MTGNTTPNPEAAVPYASAEQLGELCTKTVAWLEANSTNTFPIDGATGYVFVADGNVVAGLLPHVAQVFPDVEHFELSCVPSRKNAITGEDPLFCGFETSMPEGSLYDYHEINLYARKVTTDGKLLAESFRDSELAELSKLPHDMDEEGLLINAIQTAIDASEVGANELNLDELGALNDLVDNLDLIKQMQEG